MTSIINSHNPLSTIESLIHLIFIATLLLIFLVSAGVIIFYISGFHNGNIRKSRHLRHLLTIYPSGDENKQARSESFANIATSRSYVAINSNNVIIHIPNKPFYHFSSNSNVRKLIREQLISQEFTDFLESEFPDY